MSQICELTGKRPNYGNKVSHSNIKTRTRWLPNLRTKRFEIPELKRTFALMLSTRAFRTIDKFGGITPALMNARDQDLSPRLLKARNTILRSRTKASAMGKTAEGASAKAAAPKHTADTVKHAVPVATKAKAAKGSASTTKAPKAAAPAKAKAEKPAAKPAAKAAAKPAAKPKK